MTDDDGLHGAERQEERPRTSTTASRIGAAAANWRSPNVTRARPWNPMMSALLQIDASTV